MNIHDKVKPYADIRLKHDSETLAKIVEEANKDDSPDPVYQVIREISAKAVEMQENIIMSTIQTIGRTTYEDITVDKNKVLDMLQKYTEKKVAHEIFDHSALQSDTYKCPSCNHNLFKIYSAKGKAKTYHGNMTVYCPFCGQKLDWSEN